MSPTTIITGASKGIGKQIAKALLAKNHNVLNLSRTSSALGHENLTNIKVDLKNTDDVSNKMNMVVNKYKISNFIHCAGITNDKFFHKMNADEWEEVINVNYKSLYYLMNPVINQMRNNKNGNIVLISSINARTGAVGQTNYASSKSAMFGFTKSLAIENATKDVLVNCICPGYVETDMTRKIKPEILNNIIQTIPLKKMGRPDDISSLVEYLIEDNRYMTGSILDINGGMY